MATKGKKVLMDTHTSLSTSCCMEANFYIPYMNPVLDLRKRGKEDIVMGLKERERECVCLCVCVLDFR